MNINGYAHRRCTSCNTPIPQKHDGQYGMYGMVRCVDCWWKELLAVEEGATSWLQREANQLAAEELPKDAEGLTLVSTHMEGETLSQGLSGSETPNHWEAEWDV